MTIQSARGSPFAATAQGRAAVITLGGAWPIPSALPRIGRREQPHPRAPAQVMLPLYDTLPAIVPVARFLVRRPNLIVALSHVAVYEGGCMLYVQISGKVGGDGPHMSSSDDFDQLVFAARFGEGITAVLDGWHHIARNSGPLQLSQRGNETGASHARADSARSLWLHPLPPPQVGTLSILAPDIGPQLTCPLDGPAIAAAARQAQPYWT